MAHFGFVGLVKAAGATVVVAVLVNVVSFWPAVEDLAQYPNP